MSPLEAYAACLPDWAAVLVLSWMVLALPPCLDWLLRRPLPKCWRG